MAFTRNDENKSTMSCWDLELEPECIMKEEAGFVNINLDEQLTEVGSWVNEPFLCVRCGFTTDNLKSLVDHNKAHGGYTPYSCAICGYQTTKFWHIKNHIVAHSGKARLYSCPECEFISTYLKNVKRHIRLHYRDQENKDVTPPIKCIPLKKVDLPEKNITTENRDRVPMHSCDECSYKTSYHSNLVRHSRKHSGERPYPCTKCPYRALQHSDLTRHVRTHTGEKPYRCLLCNYKSAQIGDLAQHTKRHESREIFACFVCGFKAIQRAYVTKHILQAHGRELIKCVSDASNGRGVVIKKEPNLLASEEMLPGPNILPPSPPNLHTYVGQDSPSHS